MDLPWGDERTVLFITNVGLVTSDGPHGPNIMAVEWTHHVSYRPGLIAICIGKKRATYENIMKTREFGVNLCAADDFIMSSVSGGYSARDLDKIAALKELGFEFYEGKKINALMVKGASLNAECKLVQHVELGSHVMMVGEVLTASATERKPLAYHQGKYWRMTTPVEKLSQEQRDHNKKVIMKHERNKA